MRASDPVHHAGSLQADSELRGRERVRVFGFGISPPSQVFDQSATLTVPETGGRLSHQ